MLARLSPCLLYTSIIAINGKSGFTGIDVRRQDLDAHIAADTDIPVSYTHLLSFQEVARRCHVSTSQVIRVFNEVHIPRPSHLPRVLSIDRCV